MAVLAVQHIRRMRGGAQGQLMLGADGRVYVVKFQNNPQHMRVLANEFLASRLAAAAGLSVPGQVVDYLPEEQLAEARNLGEFAGILALDKWTGNANGRQAVFTRRQRERRYRAVFIDFGYCFHAGEWRFEDLPLRGVYYRNDVYREITGWESFEPWLSRLETMAAETVWAAANEVPPEWYGGDLADMEALVEKLLARRGRIRELIDEFRRSDRLPFPKWGIKEQLSSNPGWNDTRWDISIAGRVM